jgi:hypothetical protein
VKNLSPQMQWAWLTIATVVAEAENRYGLELYGRVEEQYDGVYLNFVTVKLWRSFGFGIYHPIADDYSGDASHQPEVIRHIMSYVRKLAEERDRR